jgi:hypothetical protein
MLFYSANGICFLCCWSLQWNGSHLKHEFQEIDSFYSDNANNAFPT